MSILLALLLSGQSIVSVSSAVYSGADRKLIFGGNRLYSACERGLDIFDISRPESIRLLGRYDTPGIANGLALRDTLVYVADNYNGLLTLSIAEVANPRLLSRVGIEYVTDVVVTETLLFLLGNDLLSYSIGNPSQPRHIGTLAGVTGFRLALKDTICFVAAQAGLLVVNLADPSSPRMVDTLPTSWLRDVEVKGDFLFCAGDTELLIYDAKTFVRLGRYDAGYLAFGVGVGESIALVCRGQQMDIHVLNIADPASPVYRGRFSAQNGPQDAVVSGSWGFAGVWSRDLLCADLANPASPVIRGRIFRPGELNGAWRYGNLVVTADRWYGVSVVDVTDVEHPIELGHCPLSGWPRRLVVRDTVAYVANYDGLACVGISNPSRPQLLGQVATPYYTYKVTLKDTLAYVAEREWNPYHGNLHCVSIANPRSPRIVGTYSTNGGGVEALAHKVDDYCYVVSQGWNLNEFAIINVSNPAAPYRVSGCNTNGYPIDVDAAGDYAYVLITSPNQRIQIVSIADTFNPQIVAEYPLQRSPISLYLNYPYLLVSYYYYGIEVFDVTDPLNIRSLGTFNTTGNSHGMYVDDDLFIYLADAHSLQILRLRMTGSVETAGSTWKRRMTIQPAELLSMTEGAFELFDATGRRVLKRLASDRTLPTRNLPAGVYYLRAEPVGGSELPAVTKVLIVD